MFGWRPSFCKRTASVREELFNPFPRCWSISKFQNIFCRGTRMPFRLLRMEHPPK